jgi:hypothetical protein
MFAAASAASFAVFACESSETSGGGLPPGSLGGPDGGAADGALINGDGAVLTDAAAEANTPSGPRDRFRHQWPVTADTPATSSYTVEADAGVVTDKVTGLQWTRDLLYQEQTAYDVGDGPGLISTQSQSVARAACAGATVGGLSGWRLPTEVEMLTIVTFEPYDWNNKQVFLDTSYGSEYFTDSNTADFAFVYDNHYHPFRFGPMSGGGPALRCVRSSYEVTSTPQAPPAGRYTVKNGSIVDTVTKLEWQHSHSPAIQQYYEATTYCDTLATSDAGVPAGGGAWRVPSLKELATLWSEGPGRTEPTVFTGDTGVDYLWTSTRYWGTQSIPDANKNIRITWSPGGKKMFTWETQQSFAFTRCVREAP